MRRFFTVSEYMKRKKIMPRCSEHLLARLTKTSRPIVESPRATSVPQTTAAESVKIAKIIQFKGICWHF